MNLARAIAERDPAELPSRRDEDWRWTDLRALIRVVPAASPNDSAALTPGPFTAAGREEIAIVNGRGPESVSVGAGETRELSLRFHAGADAGSHMARVSIALGAGANLVLLEFHDGLADDYLAGAALEIALERGARLERVVIAADHANAVSVASTRVTLAADASYAQTILTGGARRQRFETHVAHPGAGAAVRLDSLYALRDRRHADLTTTVTHEGVGGSTDQLTKGVVDEQARGVFQGKIVVSPGADQTDARMGHHALVLDDRAEVDAKPELEIWADDVACAHGNTVGALDDEAMFYAMQRGIPEAQARAMLTAAFLGQVIDRIDHDGAREVARAWLQNQAGER